MMVIPKPAWNIFSSTNMPIEEHSYRREVPRVSSEFQVSDRFQQFKSTMSWTTFFSTWPGNHWKRPQQYLSLLYTNIISNIRDALSRYVNALYL